MKIQILAVLFTLAAPSAAQYRIGPIISTTAGTEFESISGTYNLAASSVSASTPTIQLIGQTGSIVAKSVSIPIVAVDTVTAGIDGSIPTPLPENPIQASCNNPNDCQVSVQNKNSAGTSGFTATADTGNNDQQFWNCGINNSAYNGSLAGYFENPYDVFCIANGGNFDIFAQTAAKSFLFFLGANLASNLPLTVSSTGTTVLQGSLSISNGGVSASTAVVTTSVSVANAITLNATGLGIGGLTPLGQGVASSGGNTDLTCGNIGCLENFQDANGNVGAEVFPSQMAVAIDSNTVTPNANLVIQSNKSASLYVVEVSSQNAAPILSVNGNGQTVIGPGTTSPSSATLTVQSLPVSTSSFVVNVSSPNGTSMFSVDGSGDVRVSSAAFLGVSISTQVAGTAGALVTVTCVSGSYALSGGCSCSGGVAVTSFIDMPNPTMTQAGTMPTGWQCQQAGTTGGVCAAFVLCSRIRF